MADIFHEIDEDLRRERFARLWKRYGWLLIAVALLIVAGVAVWRGIEWWNLQQQQESSARFEAALKLAAEGKSGEAEGAFAELERSGTAGYATLARFRAASALAPTDRAAAVAAYDAIAADGRISPLMRDLARLRAGFLLVDTAPLADVTARMQPLSEATGPFRNSAREAIGLSQYKAGDYAAAAKTFEAILSDGQAAPGLRQRADLMQKLASASAPPAETAPAPAATAPAAAPAAPAVQ
ncbi:tetratricopeptide repeat protein [Ancylobacter oerskovii]|uniref:Tetratricopeptide repeat protein n=1 Tax=Ancylobacter oerskovii TaxID=459519 RepID=A0ABW4Z3R8_9HYPH|nr:tetratricopeptide repeat protein [Ancylobacter oerskovii]MBS7545903.1 tetratricopeptide repeat protein [Ancylobacter oerskovii]